MKIAITGSTGLIGTALTSALAASGHDIVRLVRGAPDRAGRGTVGHRSAGRSTRTPLQDVGAIIHLAGENIGQRWSDGVKQRVLDSRVDGTRLIAETAARLPGKPVLVCASAIGFYGNRGDDEVDESDSAAKDSSQMSSRNGKPRPTPRAQRASAPFICGRGSFSPGRAGRCSASSSPSSSAPAARWEAASSGGAGSRSPTRSRRIGSPSSTRSEGAVNVTAPGSTTNLGFTKALGRALHRPTILPLPGFAVRAAFGQMGAGDAPRGAASHTDEDRRGRLHVQPPRHRLRPRERTRPINLIRSR